MAVPLNIVLSRISDEKWKIIIGDSWRVIKEIIGYQSSQEVYVEFALSVQEPYELIRDQEKRKILFRVMKENEIKELLKLLGVKDDDNPLYTLTNTKFGKNSKNETLLFEYLSIEPPVASTIEKKEDHEVIKPEYSMFDHQRKIILKAQHYIDNKKPVLIHMPTGSGKTRIAMNLVARVLQSNHSAIVLWLVYNEELCNQAADEFTKTWKVIGDHEVTLHRFYSNHKFGKISDGLIVASLGKLWSACKSDNLFIPKLKPISLIVFDEAHQSVAKTYMEIVNELLYINEGTGLIGLTATPGRSYDDLDEDGNLSKFFGSNKIKMDVEGYSNPIKYLIENNYLSETTFEKLELRTSFSDKEKLQLMNELDIPQPMLEKIGNDTVRNLEIITAIIKMKKKGHKRIILFAPSVNNAIFMASILKAEKINAMAITANTNRDVRNDIIARFKEDTDESIVLCNFNVLSTGFDAPKTTCIVIARPTKSLVLYSQMVGRAIRGTKVGGTKTAEVLTVVDTELPGFGNIAEAFDHWEDVWNE